ncbi:MULTISPECIES: hypothetical protein [unclassified Nocardioides]|uniref:hypothetical protein n=1 Tax=unclassified Nocardioides TaxID=2615069 RepID=UPI0006F21DEB|nr:MULTISPECIES: hypothetical protein [unclassified Nocardioides]KRA29685.1 hypothetical protein ASD81_22290 [Nocardioides sp. Root614]KRA88139.1 hypothetical protein ASD84_19325 [Nocardioides sp. Root682]
MRRHNAAALGILLTFGLTACGDSSDPPIDVTLNGPGHGTLASPDVVSAHADDVLVSIYSTGGSGAPGTRVPDAEVRTDGTVYLNGKEGLGVDTYTLTPAGLDRVREAFKTVAFGKYDYEESNWTDQPVTSVFTTLGGRAEAVSVYGLGHDEDVDDYEWDRLLDAIDELDDLARTAATTPDGDIATRRASYRPERVALVLTDNGGDEDGSIDWPLARPLAGYDQGTTELGSSCIVVTGSDVVTLEALRKDDLDGRPWSTGTTSLDADVRPILRGETGPCTPAAPETPVG